MVFFQTKGSPGSSFHESEGYEQLANVLVDLFVAGTETTSNTLNFAILFMVRLVLIFMYSKEANNNNMISSVIDITRDHSTVLHLFSDTLMYRRR